MKILKMVALATLSFGASAILPSIATAQTAQVPAMPTKANLTKAVAKYELANGEDRKTQFKSIVRSLNDVISNAKLESIDAPGNAPEMVKYQKYIQQFNDVVMAERSGDHSQTVSLMKGFLNLM